MRKILIYLLLALFFFTKTAEAFAVELTVAVSANVQYAFEELKTIFEKKTGIILHAVVGSSGKFYSQIQNGAPFDVFLSADMDYPTKLEHQGLTFNKPKIYGYGILVLWTMTGADLSNGVRSLSDSKIGKIAVASAQNAPYGKEAIDVLKHYDLDALLKDKLVFAENVAQVNQFVMTKAVDVGITSGSSVLAPNMKDQGRWVKVSQDAYEPIAQGVVILKNTKTDRLENAKKFYDFLFTIEASEIFKKYGYLLP